MNPFFKKVLHGREVFGGVILLLLGGYLIFLFETKKLYLLIHPDFIIYSLITGIVLALVGIFQLVTFFPKASNRQKICGCKPTPWWVFVFAFCFLSIAFFFQPKPLSSATALTRQAPFNDAGFTRQRTVPPFIINTENRKLLDWAQLFFQNPEPDRYKGLKAKVKGFVLQDDEYGPEYFSLSQFVLSCCAADARPVGILVHADPVKFSLKNDQWIEASGTFLIKEVDGEKQIVLHLENAQPIAVPQNPYEAL